MNDLLILTEGGEGIGLGHITRCSAIYAWFENAGMNCRMIIDWHGPAPNPTDFEEEAWVANGGIKNATGNDFRAVLVDSYKAPATVYSEIKKVTERLFVLDDYHRLPAYTADLIINPNIYGKSVTYAAKAAGGNKYVILREAFRKCTARYRLRNTISNILVTVGGSDFRSLLPVLAEMLKEADSEVVFICGTEQTARQMKDRFADCSAFRFYGYTEAGLMSRLMLDCDVAISACGQTLHELAYLGIPSIGICMADDQLLNQQAYIAAGFLSTSISWDSKELKSLVLAELAAMNAPEKRAAKSKGGLKIIDGKGVERIAKLILHG